MGQKVITKLGSFDSLLFQSVAEMITSKFNKVYFKARKLFQSKANCYFKVGLLIQNGAVTLEWGITDASFNIFNSCFNYLLRNINLLMRVLFNFDIINGF